MGLIHNKTFQYYASAVLVALFAAQATSPDEPVPASQVPQRSLGSAIDGILHLEEATLKVYEAALPVAHEMKEKGEASKDSCNVLIAARSAFRGKLNEIDAMGVRLSGQEKTREEGRYLQSLITDVKHRDSASVVAQLEQICDLR